MVLPTLSDSTIFSQSNELFALCPHEYKHQIT